MPLKVVRCLSSELINQVVVVARIAVDGAAHSKGLAVCKTLPAGQVQFGHEVEIGGQFAAGVPAPAASPSHLSYSPPAWRDFSCLPF